MGTAPQRERSDTPDPRRGFAGELKDSHGTTARALRHARSPQRVHRRAQGFARHHTDPRRGFAGERSDTPDPRRGFAGELKDSHGTTARALRHARSPQRVHRRAQGFARHHTDPRRGFAGERSDTPDPRRGFAGELKDSHGTTARALRHARSPQRVHRRAQNPLRGSGVSERSRCGAVRILELAGEPSAGIGRVGSLAGEPSAGIGVVPCESLSSPMNPLRGSGVSERSRCGAVRILELAGEPSAGIGRVGSLAGEPSAGIGVVPCESLSSPMNPLRGSGVSERSR